MDGQWRQESGKPEYDYGDLVGSQGERPDWQEHQRRSLRVVHFHAELGVRSSEMRQAPLSWPRKGFEGGEPKGKGLIRGSDAFRGGAVNPRPEADR